MSNIPKDAIQCLDKGFVRLVDSMGGDEAIVQAAARELRGEDVEPVVHEQLSANVQHPWRWQQ